MGKADAETENGVHNEVRETAILAPPVDPHRQTRFYKVIYRGKIGVRLTPTRPAPEDGQVSYMVSARTSASHYPRRARSCHTTAVSMAISSSSIGAWLSSEVVGDLGNSWRSGIIP